MVAKQNSVKTIADQILINHEIIDGETIQKLESLIRKQWENYNEGFDFNRLSLRSTFVQNIVGASIFELLKSQRKNFVRLELPRKQGEVLVFQNMPSDAKNSTYDIYHGVLPNRELETGSASMDFTDEIATIEVWIARHKGEILSNLSEEPKVFPLL